MEPSIYLSEEGNKERSSSPFKEKKIKDEYNFASYKDASEMNQEEVIEILKKRGTLLKFINNPTDEMVMTAIRYNSATIYYVKNVSEDLFNKILEHDNQYTEFFDVLSKCVFPYNIIYLNNLSLEYINKVVEKTHSIYGIKVNLLDKETILNVLKEFSRRNIKHLIPQKDTFSKEDFNYLIDNLFQYKIEKRSTTKSTILKRFFNEKEYQCDEICLSAIKLDWRNYQGVKIKSKVVYLECLKYNNKYTKDLLKMGVSIEEVLSVNGLALKYIENPTIEQINIAIKQNGKAIEFVKDKTEELCLLAVQQDGLAIRYIKNPSLVISVTAAQNHPKAIMLIDQSLRPEVREEIKNQTFKLNDATVTRKDILVRLEIIKSVNSKLHKLYKECFEKELSYTPLEMVDLCLKDLIKKYDVSENVLKTIIKNQLDIIAYTEEVKKPFKKIIERVEPLEKRLYDIFTHGQKPIIGFIDGNKISIKGETLEYELPYSNINLGNGTRVLKRIEDKYIVEYGQEDLNINFKEIK